ncbi:MAG TPA: hypothetical protein VI588_00950 [Candidatus Gracilibacteria bacterium]|nr:hypothetical protein [Candidatus Gracilibacteria bacterium]
MLTRCGGTQAATAPERPQPANINSQADHLFGNSAGSFLYGIGSYGVFRIEPGTTQKIAVGFPPRDGHRQIFLVWPSLMDKWDKDPVLRGDGLSVFKGGGPKRSMFIYRAPQKAPTDDKLSVTAGGFEINTYLLEISSRLCDIYDEADPICNPVVEDVKPRLFSFRSDGIRELSRDKPRTFEMYPIVTDQEWGFFVVWPPPVLEVYETDIAVTGEPLQLSEDPAVILINLPSDRKRTYPASITTRGVTFNFSFVPRE